MADRGSGGQNDGLPVATLNLSDARPGTLVPARSLVRSVSPPRSEFRSSVAASSSGPIAYDTRVLPHAPEGTLHAQASIRPTAAQLQQAGPPRAINPAKAPPATLLLAPLLWNV